MENEKVTMLSEKTYEKLVPFGEDFNTALYVNINGFMKKVFTIPFLAFKNTSKDILPNNERVIMVICC